MGVRKKRGARGRHACSFLRPLLRQERMLLPITFKRVKCSNLLLCIMINSPPPPHSSRADHCTLHCFLAVHYFLYTRGTCVTLKQRSGQFTELFEGVTRLHPNTPPTLYPFFQQSFAREELCSRPPRGNCCICFENKMAVWEVYQY